MADSDTETPPLGGVNNNSLADDVVPSKMAQSPVPELRHRWRKLKSNEKELFLNDP